MSDIFVFNGSLNVDSYSNKVIDFLLEEVLNTFIDNTSVYTLKRDRVNIFMCDGCLDCFNGKVCPLIQYDQFDTVLTKLLKSNYIIFSTPIYSDSVSSFSKVFIERITYLSHLMALSGKKVIFILTSNGGGMRTVANYLYKVFNQLGGEILDFILINKNWDSEKTREYLNSVKEKIETNIKEDLVLNNGDLERILHQLKRLIVDDSLLYPAEKDFWGKYGLSNVESYIELKNLYKKHPDLYQKLIYGVTDYE